MNGLKPYLDAIRTTSDGLVQAISSLSADQWSDQTNCPPWTVQELAAHMVTSGQGFVASIRRGLAGETDPPPRGSSASPGDPRTVARELSHVTDEFIALYDGLSEAQLETICFHRRGNRSVRWYAAHRLAELAFHGWDLRLSLGQTAILGDDVARLLLPTLLESNVPRTYAAGLSEQRGIGERYRLAVRGDAELTWTVVIEPDELHVLRGEHPADVTLAAPAATLALLAYGRTTVADPHIEAQGDPELIGRFPRVFPRP